MITFELDRGWFNYRVVAVVIDDGHVLAGRETDGDFWFLPGGRCELMERSDDAVRREFREEFELDCLVDRLLWIVENFFRLRERTFHEIAFYYLASLPADSPLLDKTSVHEFRDAGTTLEARWFPLSKIPSINLVPAFLRIELFRLPSTPERIVCDELRR